MKQTLIILLVTLVWLNLVACGKTDGSQEEQTIEPTTEDSTVVEESPSVEEEAEDRDTVVEAPVEPTSAENFEEPTEEPSEEESDINESDKENESALKLYDDLLKKIVSGEAMIGDEGEAYDYSFAESPGFALYDMDKDGIDELFVTGRMDNAWHTYTVYYVHDGTLSDGKLINQYDPENDLWIYGFDFLTEAYSFNSKDGFTEVWSIDYPLNDDVITYITYVGQDTREISVDELNEMLSRQILEPTDLTWQKLDESISILEM